MKFHSSRRRKTPVLEIISRRASIFFHWILLNWPRNSSTNALRRDLGRTKRTAEIRGCWQSAFEKKPQRTGPFRRYKRSPGGALKIKIRHQPEHRPRIEIRATKALISLPGFSTEYGQHRQTISHRQQVCGNILHLGVFC